MMQLLESAVSLWRLTFRAARRETVLALLLIPLGMAGPVLIALWTNLLTDAAINQNAARVAQVAAGVGITILLMYFTQGLGIRLRLTLSERARLVLQSDVMRLVGRVRTLELHEGNEAFDRLELLRQGQEEIISGPDRVFIALGYAVQLVLSVTLLASVNPWLLLLPVFGLAPTLALLFSQRLLQASEVQSSVGRRLARQTLLTATSAAGASETVLNDAGTRLDGIYSQAMSNAGALIDRAQLRVASLQTLGWLLFAAAFASSIVVTINQALQGQVSQGQVVMVILLAATVSGHVSNITSAVGGIGSMFRKVSHYRWLHDFVTSRSQDAETGEVPPGNLAEGVRFENVWFRYPGTENWVLRGLDLKLPAGTLTAIAGRNGAGKSTVVKLLLGLYTPDKGRITIDGTDLAELNLAAWRQRCTAVFQELARFELQLGESVGIGDLTRMDDVARQADVLQLAGAESLLHEPGLNAQLGGRWGGVNLSGGQWQKLALARAHFRASPLLSVFDEVTAALDPDSERNIFVDYANGWRDQNTSRGAALFITHRFPSVGFADQIVVLKDGVADESGTHRELLAAGGAYAELYRMQAALFSQRERPDNE